MNSVTKTIRFLNNRYLRFGGAKYTINEPTTILNHSLQTANYLNFNLNCKPSEVVAGLLHDYGHIVNIPISPDTGIDDHHEHIGAKALREMGFPDSVTIPISLHVKAKRYLITVDPNYKLSSGSKLSLELQGGKMTTEELTAFEKNPYYSSALFLRIADDYGKCSYRVGKDLLCYEEYIADVLIRHQ